MSHLEALDLVGNYFEPLGFECYPFTIGSYNEVVKDKFKLNYDFNTFCLFILNTPSMFERTFLPYVLESVDKIDTMRDPIDDCMNFIFKRIKQILNDKSHDVDIIQDYELTATRRAKILLQTCAHITGAAYFYQKKDLNQNEAFKSSMGVCIHPKYGGWFAMRGVLIFKNILTPNLVTPKPIDVLNDDPKLIDDLLNRFNTDWKSGSYRDIIPVEEKYSNKQIEYFNTDPNNRKQLLFKWFIGSK